MWLALEWRILVPSYFLCLSVVNISLAGVLEFCQYYQVSILQLMYNVLNKLGKMKFHHSTHTRDNIAEKIVIDKQKTRGSTGVDSKMNTLQPIIANSYLSADVINSALRNMLPHCRRHRLVKFLLQCWYHQMLNFLEGESWIEVYSHIARANGWFYALERKSDVSR